MQGGLKRVFSRGRGWVGLRREELGIITLYDLKTITLGFTQAARMDWTKPVHVLRLSLWVYSSR